MIIETGFLAYWRDVDALLTANGHRPATGGEIDAEYPNDPSVAWSHICVERNRVLNKEERMVRASHRRWDVNNGRSAWWDK